MKAQNSEIKTSIRFTPVPAIKKTKVTYSFTTLIQENGEGYNCYIPGFDIYFYSKTKGDITIRGGSMMETYFDFWIKNQGFRAFVLELNKIGFRTENHTYDMSRLLKKKKISSTKFKMLRGSIPSEFSEAQKFNQEADFAIAG